MILVFNSNWDLKNTMKWSSFWDPALSQIPRGTDGWCSTLTGHCKNKIIWRWYSVLPRITPVYPLFNNWPLIDLDISRPLTGYTSSIFIPKEQFFIGNYFEFLVVLLHVSRVSLVFYFIFLYARSIFVSIYFGSEMTDIVRVGDGVIFHPQKCRIVINSADSMLSG